MNIFWFRRDLRVDDNVGLFHALNSSEEVLPIFIFDENIAGEENLLKNGYRLLWDVGNLVFLKNYKKEES